MDKLIRDTIDKIKKDHVIPEARWKFLLVRYSMWVIFGMIIFSGAASFSAAYFLLSSLDWDLYRFMHVSALSYGLSLIPYVWIILIAIALAIAFVDMRKTETGYRFSRLKIILMTVGGIMIFGIMMSAAGMGSFVDSLASKSVPLYGRMMVTKKSQWSQSEKGFLSGIIESSDGNNLGLRDFDGKYWKIILDRDVLIRPVVSLKKGDEIKIIGEKQTPDTFVAKEIRPWMGMGRGMMKGNSDNMPRDGHGRRGGNFGNDTGGE